MEKRRKGVEWRERYDEKNAIITLVIGILLLEIKTIQNIWRED